MNSKRKSKMATPELNRSNISIIVDVNNKLEDIEYELNILQ